MASSRSRTISSAAFTNPSFASTRTACEAIVSSRSPTIASAACSAAHRFSSIFAWPLIASSRSSIALSIPCIAAQRSSINLAWPSMASSRSTIARSIPCIADQRSSSMRFQLFWDSAKVRAKHRFCLGSVHRRALIHLTAESKNSTATILGNS